jgi:rhodanese-related sulfurtransferase
MQFYNPRPLHPLRSGTAPLCPPDKPIADAHVKFIIDNWYLILVAAVSGGLLLWPSISRSAGGAVSPSEAVRLINREKAVVIDVRDAADFAAGHVVGSRHIPLDSLGQGAQLPTNKALPLIVVCATGARAGRAVATLRKLGYDNVRSLAGGMAAWREASLPVEKKG